MTQLLASLLLNCLGRPRYDGGGEGLKLCLHCNRRHKAHWKAALDG